MPHITIKPFDTSTIKEDRYFNKTKVLFKAEDLTNSSELIAIELNGNRFILELKKSNKSWILKSNKITRPLDVNLIKRAIGDISKDLELDIINSNITIHHTKAKLANEYQKSIEDFIDIDFGFKSLSIEVGFGSGKHLLYQAINNPDELFIGIEIHTPSAQQLLRQIELQGLKNIWIINYDARLLLEMIPSNSINKIFVHFPIPWDKKPHRRVISSIFLKESMRALKKGGKLELRTDSHKYFWYSLHLFLGDEVYRSSIKIRKNNSLDVISKYEARWRREKKDIYDIYVESKEESKARVLDFDFNLDTLIYRDDLVKKISTKPIILEESFIHFEKIYRVSNGSILLKLAFGSFNRPEHKYIFIDKKGSYYFGQNPTKTVTNYKTHLKIKEYLSV